MSDIAIKISHISKIYKIFAKPSDRVKEALHPFGKRFSTDFYALNDIDLDIKKGEIKSHLFVFILNCHLQFHQHI